MWLRGSKNTVSFALHEGLVYGGIDKYKKPNYKQILKQKEDELVDYFLYEMRKEPSEKAELPVMPIS